MTSFSFIVDNTYIHGEGKPFGLAHWEQNKPRTSVELFSYIMLACGTSRLRKFLRGTAADEEQTKMACCPPNAHGHLASSRDHEGTKITVSGGTELYSTGSLSSSGRAILICPDIRGWDSGRLRNIADHLADAGYLVVVPKILQPACVTTHVCAFTVRSHFAGTIVVQMGTRFLLMSLYGFQRLVAGLS
jgi:hypothetical protein